MAGHTTGGPRSFLLEAPNGQAAVETLRKRLVSRERVTDVFGGLYLPVELDTETLRLEAGPVPDAAAARKYIYRADGTRVY